MTFWNTSDEVTNTNLSYLESIAQDRQPPFDSERVTQKFAGAIEVMKMLPTAVGKHFDVQLSVGDLVYGWSTERRTEKALELCDALARGFDQVRADSSLQKGGLADLNDRPQSRGEVILSALEQFKQRVSTGHFDKELSALRSAIYGSSLQRDVTEIDRILARKVWKGHTSRDYEVYGKIHDMEFAAKRYHRIPA